MMKNFTCLVGAIAFSGMALLHTGSTYAAGSAQERPDLAPLFQSAHVEGTFVLLDPQKQVTLRYNPERARTPYSPASTFKIPNTLIALDSGVASGPEFFLDWNREVAPREAWWPAAWAKGNTLQSALSHSVVWYYQELARRTGPQRMQTYVDRLDYGNRDISGGIDRFWLSGGLRISAEQQVEFLRRFYAGELNVSERAIRTTKDMLVLETTPAYRLSGKTGWAGLGGPNEPQIGWLVGYLERNAQVYFFALNIDIRKNEDAAARMPIVKAALQKLGVM